MAKISYVNGRYVNHCDATVHMEDRGYQFSDGIYEVMAFYNRTLLDEGLHMQRLLRSLKELHIAPPMSETALRLVSRELIARNNRTDGTLYMQISRGVARRDHPFPKAAKPSVVMALTGPKMPKEKEVREGVSVIVRPDLRWARRDIKSISLLPNVLAKQEATAAGAREAWLVDEKGIISEGAVSNNAIVNAKGEVITHPANQNILGGITRDVMIKLACKNNIKVIERPFSLKEAKAAKEAFLTSTTSNVLPVTRIDNAAVGNGKPGPVTLKLLKLFYEHIYEETGKQWN
jgi:D-alanine transaminase